MRRSLSSVLALVCAGVFAASAPATVSVTKHSVPVSAGDTASVTVIVSPKAPCTFSVNYAITGSKAAGPGTTTRVTTIQNARLFVKLVWKWTTGPNTSRGAWPVRIDCGKAGKATTRITVR